MLTNDIVFLNLHRKYLNFKPNNAGFLGIYLLAAFLKENGYYAQSYEGTLSEGKLLVDEICGNNAVSVIGLYCDYENVTENIFLSKYIKDTYGIPVIIGGPQAVELKKEFYEESLCDAVVRGEGELTVLELMECFLDGTKSLFEIDGIAYLQDETIKYTKDRDLITNLDALPFITEDCYLKPPEYSVTLTIMTGRGCPFHCAFCHEGHHTKKVRFRSVDNVIKEIERFLLKCKNEVYTSDIYIAFADDTFTLIPDRVKELCDKLVELQKIKNFKWFCEGHIHTLYNHPEMIEYIAKAGCHRIQLGIEAGTQQILDAFRKGSTPEEILSVVKMCVDAGINQIYSNIILGAAFFTNEVFEKNLAFAKKLIELGPGIIELKAVSYWPLAGTSITNNPDFYDIKIMDYDFYTSNGDFPQTETEEFNRLDILRYVQKMNREINRIQDNMLLNDEVPYERVLSWLPISQSELLVQDGWVGRLYLINYLYNWYDLQAHKEAYRSNDLSSEQLKLAHPIRVASLVDIMDVDDNGVITIGNLQISEFDKEVLIYCSGKLNTRKMTELISQKYPEVTIEKVVEALNRLEKSHLILYSLY